MAAAAVPQMANIQVNIPCGLYVQTQGPSVGLKNDLERFLTCTVSSTKLDGSNHTITRPVSYNEKFIILSCPAFSQDKVICR